jgi:hypothetical protein
MAAPLGASIEAAGVAMPTQCFGTMNTWDMEAIGGALDAGYRHFDLAMLYGNHTLRRFKMHPKRCPADFGVDVDADVEPARLTPRRRS